MQQRSNITTYTNTTLTKLRLLLSTLHSSQIIRPVLNIELNIDLALQVRLPVIQSAGLDDCVVGHDLQLGVQARAAVGAEEVLVDLATGAGDVVSFRGSWNR